MTVCRTVSSVALLAVVLAVTVSGPALAHDSLAPRGAHHGWLPAEDAWVMQHWVPFEEGRLYEVLGVDNQQLEHWLRDDHRTIGQLARSRRGLTVDQLSDLLLEPGHNVRPRTRRVLRERTGRMLTQGHLAQHVLFHYYHGTSALENTRRIFGVPRRRYQRLRRDSWTPFQIGRSGGRAPARVVQGMHRTLRRATKIGVANGSHTAAQANHMLGRRLALLPCFLRRPLAKFDRGNPYGDPNNGHGRHRRSTRNGIQIDSKQSVARSHSLSCWHEPPLRWTGVALPGPFGAAPAAPRVAPATETICHLS